MTHLVNPSFVLKDRECYGCGSTETYIGRQKTSSKPHYHWYGNGIEDQWLCLRCENHLIKGPKYHPLTNPRRNKKNYKSCKCSNGHGHQAKPSSGVIENYSSPPLLSSMEAVGVRVSQFVHSNINKANKQQSDCGGSVM
jgi:hypothetical protein